MGLVFGMILDGDQIVGNFDYKQSSDSIKFFTDINIHGEYMDISSGQTNKMLQYILVEEVIKDGKERVGNCLEAFGMGFVVKDGSLWSEGDVVKIEKGMFIPSQEEKNAN